MSRPFSTVTLAAVLLLAAAPVALLAPPAEAAATAPPECYGAATGVDVLFLLDLTGSMGGVLHTVQTEATAMMDDLAAEYPDIRFAAASHMDYPEYYAYPGYAAAYGGAGDYPWRLDRDLTTDKASVQAAVNGMMLGWGADGPESYTRALYEATESVSWGAGRQKVLVMFADNVPHDEDWNGRNTGGDPGRDAIAQTHDDLDFQTVVASLAAADIEVVGVNSGGAGHMMIYLAEATGGSHAFLESDLRAQVVQLIRRQLVSDEEAPSVGFHTPNPTDPMVYQDGVPTAPSPFGGNAVLSGDLPVTVAATDNCLVSRVYLTLEPYDEYLGEDATAPFEFLFEAANRAPGTYLVKATALDWVGRVATVTIPILVVRPTEGSEALGLFAAATSPATAEVLAGGASARGPSASEVTRYDGRFVPAGPLTVVANTLVDSAAAYRNEEGSAYAYAASHVSAVCLLSCRIQVESLRAEAIALHDATDLTGSIDTSGSHVTKLTIDGLPTPVTAPNTVIPIPGVGALHVLETTLLDTPFGKAAQVNGLRLVVETATTRGEVVLASAKASAGYLPAASLGPERALQEANDAGLGGDAPDTIETAAPLAPGAYGALLEERPWPQDDRDVFRLDVAENTRIVIDAAMAKRAHVHTTAPPVTTGSLLPGNQRTDLYVSGYVSLYDSEGILRDSLDMTYEAHVEFNTDKPGPWYVMFHGDVAPGMNYTFTYAAAPVVFVPTGDAGTFSEAPAACAAGLTVAEGVHAGSLARGDDADSFRFSVGYGEEITLVLKTDEAFGANFDLELYDPDCEIIGGAAISGDGFLKSFPDPVVLRDAAKNGLYTARVVRTEGSGNYALVIHASNLL
ncbi:MAG TPA: choice-of-anchor P family protein [Candidatus Thermoplasmatota archaeon]|nr:choice-of-anchor P family protein [Candidatus Thermoplasmatota archaeon]